jgi:6-phosphofructokinase 1
MLKIPPIAPRNVLKSIAVLTSGGDAPGMNAAIRAVVRTAVSRGCAVHGVSKGYSGLLEGRLAALQASSVANIIQRGGTILKTDRCKAFYRKSARREAAAYLRREGIEGLVVIGGDGSFNGAALLQKETGFPAIGIPGTIDNDIAGTEDTIGFDTAVNTAIDAIDRIRDTASSHDRIFLVEVMGRSSGFIALEVGIGGGAEAILVPEKRESLREICANLARGTKRGKSSSIIVIAEGRKPGLVQNLALGLGRRGYSPKICTLGHIQRGGSPTAHDRMLASALGASAAHALISGESNSMAGVQDDRVVLVPFKNVIGRVKALPMSLLKMAQTLAS